MFLHRPIADLIARIKNGYRSRQLFVDYRISKDALTFLSILKDQGFIDFFTTSLPAEETVSKHTGRIYLKYSGHPWKSYKDPALKKIHYVKKNSQISLKLSELEDYEILRKRKKMEILVLLTPKGMLDHLSAIHQRVGGTLFCILR